MTTIQSIRDHRGDPGINIEYLISWANGTESWEPQSNLMDVEYVSRYWKNFQNKEKREKKRIKKMNHTIEIDTDTNMIHNYTNQNNIILNSPISSPMGGGVDANVIQESKKIKSDNNIYITQSPQEVMDTFINQFIDSEHLTKPHLNLKLRENKGVADRLQALLFTSGVKSSYPDVLRRLRYILSQRFTDQHH